MASEKKWKIFRKIWSEVTSKTFFFKLWVSKSVTGSQTIGAKKKEVRKRGKER